MSDKWESGAQLHLWMLLPRKRDFTEMAENGSGKVPWEAGEKHPGPQKCRSWEEASWRTIPAVCSSCGGWASCQDTSGSQNLCITWAWVIFYLEGPPELIPSLHERLSWQNGVKDHERWVSHCCHCWERTCAIAASSAPHPFCKPPDKAPLLQGQSKEGKKTGPLKPRLY